MAGIEHSYFGMVYRLYASIDAEAGTPFSKKIQVVYFVNSGTEANELAMLMARLYSGNLSMVALRNGYHGGSAGTIGLTGLQTWKYPIPQVCILLLGDITSSDFLTALSPYFSPIFFSLSSTNLRSTSKDDPIINVDLIDAKISTEARKYLCISTFFCQAHRGFI
jgi:hypothetical protein